MRPLIAAIITAVAVAACGGSSKPTLAQRCHQYGEHFAQRFIQGFATRPHQQTINQLAQATTKLCIDYGGPNKIP
jgi:hypothetical protein